ncbi:MAG: DUF3619 family protein [Betaproteobacteria bacterium]|nr:DUF3619 family protein [Betaproteobacteria bacterium]MSQ87723.1 DUF3619 family protein [Betaproteobacteria bacterium]
MNDEIKFSQKIRQALNEGSRLDGKSAAHMAHVIERLRAAREQALARRKPEREPALAWARGTAVAVIGGFGGFSGFSVRLLLPTALLVAGLIAIYSGQQEQRAADVEELDAQLLTDDLPIDAYLDRGFETWLKKISAN